MRRWDSPTYVEGKEKEPILLCRCGKYEFLWEIQGRKLCLGGEMTTLNGSIWAILSLSFFRININNGRKKCIIWGWQTHTQGMLKLISLQILLFKQTKKCKNAKKFNQRRLSLSVWRNLLFRCCLIIDKFLRLSKVKDDEGWVLEMS